MMDPTLALLDVIGARLAADPAIAAHVAPLNIRSGSIRPETTPAIVLAPPRVTVLGRAAGAQIVAEVRMLLHVWAVEDGSSTGQAVAGAVMLALMDAPEVEGVAIDDWERPVLTWGRDPDPARTYAQGTIGLRAVLRWRAE